MDQGKRSGQNPITSSRFAFRLIFRFSSVIPSTLRYTLRAFGIANRRLIPNDISLPFQLHSLSIPNMPQGLMRAVRTAIHPNLLTRANSHELRYAVAVQTVCSISSSPVIKSLRVRYIAAPVLFAIFNLSAGSDFLLLLLLLQTLSLAIRLVTQRIALLLWIYFTNSCLYEAIFALTADLPCLALRKI